MGVFDCNPLSSSCRGSLYQKCSQANFRPRLSTTPLLSVSVVSLISYVAAIYFCLKDGFKITEFGDHLAVYGTVVALLLNFSHVFNTVRIIYCIKSKSFPTYHEVKELRDTVMQLASTFLIGIAVIFVTYNWYAEFGEIKLKAALTLDQFNSSLNNKFNVFKEVKKLTPEDEKRMSVNDSINWFRPFIMAEPLKNPKPSNETSHDDRYNIFENHPFVSLFFSSCFSIGLAGAVAVIATFFARSCVYELEAERRNNTYTPDFTTGETERSPLNPRRFPNSDEDVVEFPLVPAEQGSDTVCYSEVTGVTGISEDIASPSTSSDKTSPQQSATASGHGSEHGEHSTPRKVRFGERPSNLVRLSPHCRQGADHYLCSNCNSVLTASPKWQKYGIVPTRRSHRKKRDPTVSTDPNRTADPTSIKQNTRKPNGATPVEEMEPFIKEVETGSKSNTNITEGLMSQGALLQTREPVSRESYGKAAVKTLRSPEKVEGESIEMTRK